MNQQLFYKYLPANANQDVESQIVFKPFSVHQKSPTLEAVKSLNRCYCCVLFFTYILSNLLHEADMHH